MDFAAHLSIVGSILVALGGGAVIVFALARWLGGVWANRILENERTEHSRESELLVRRRNVYTKLAISMRVFLKRHDPKTSSNYGPFLEAYDEASVWAPDSVMNALGRFLDLNSQYATLRDAGFQEAMQVAFSECLTEMRKDAGFPHTTFRYRFVSF